MSCRYHLVNLGKRIIIKWILGVSYPSMSKACHFPLFLSIAVVLSDSWRIQLLGCRIGLTWRNNCTGLGKQEWKGTRNWKHSSFLFCLHRSAEGRAHFIPLSLLTQACQPSGLLYICSSFRALKKTGAWNLIVGLEFLKNYPTC